jgi:hypothetical protein
MFIVFVLQHISWPATCVHTKPNCCIRCSSDTIGTKILILVLCCRDHLHLVMCALVLLQDVIEVLQDVWEQEDYY